MSKTVLILFTIQFPYGIGDVFLETEIQYYSSFDKVICIPLGNNLRGVAVELPKNVSFRKIKRQNNNSKQILLSSVFFDEIFELLKQGRLNAERIRMMLNFYKQSARDAKSVQQILKEEGISKHDKVIFYSYWAAEGALTAVFLKDRYPSSKAVTRCHRIDLLEEKNNAGYLPFRKAILQKLNCVYPISYAGKRYLERRYRFNKTNIRVSKLGVLNKEDSTDSKEGIQNRNVLRIVSCSNIIPLKRVDKIVQTLSQIKDVAIDWTHFGSGMQETQVKDMCKKKLSSNITYHFMGLLSNKEILKKYQTDDFHVMLHLSESEGIPVSFMEAMSYGIPVIAASVGGVSEIVQNGISGYLVDKEVNISEVADKLILIKEMNEEQYLKLRKTTKTLCEKYYNADVNYEKFIRELKGE